MLSAPDALASIRNSLLSGLPPNELAFLLPALRPVFLWSGATLHKPGEPIFDVYFVERGMVSLVSTSAGGIEGDVAPIGRSGVVGAELVMGEPLARRRSVVRICTQALRMPGVTFIEGLSCCPTLRFRVARFHQLLRTFENQGRDCAEHHDAGRRLSRWLLTISDSVPAERFPLSQELQGEVLGIDTMLVQVAEERLAGEGLIDFTRGQVAVLDRQRLEQSACSCYRNLRLHEALLSG